MKKYIIPGLILTLVLITSIWIFAKNKKAPKEIDIVPTPTTVLPTISGKIKVDLTTKNSNTAVVLKISGMTDDIESVEYELTYLTGSSLPRGVLGKISTQKKSEIVRDDIVLGTCSSGKCVYDTGVKSIDLSLKFNSPKGVTVYQKTFQL